MIDLNILKEQRVAVWFDTREELNDFYDCLINSTFPASSSNIFAEQRGGQKIVSEGNRKWGLNNFRPGFFIEFKDGKLFRSCLDKTSMPVDIVAIPYKRLIFDQIIDRSLLTELFAIQVY